MRTHLALFALALCALPLMADNGPRRVVAPCELTTAAVVPSGLGSDTGGREFAVRVFNNSPRAITLPRNPVFGWRVDTRHKDSWKLKAQGGPAHTIIPTDPHVVVFGNSETGPLVEIAPAHSADFRAFLPEAEKALVPDSQVSTFRLTLYWAASAEFAGANPAVPPCALSPEWVVTARPRETSK